MRRSSLAALLGFIFLLSSCSHLVMRSSDGASGMPLAVHHEVVDGSADVGADQPPQSDLNDSGSDLSAIPIEVNRLVLKWIDYFQGRGRPHMERYLSRSTRYMPVMKEILRKEGLPEDLIYIALIESGFSSTAHSSASAVGYWQFIRGTGRRYGLRIDSFVDERRDFIHSTVAAASYFKGLYNLFGAWYLAIASYNVGENRVKNLVMKYHTRDFWKLARENKLPAETSNYVPKFLAARLIAKEPEKYGFTDIEYMPPLEFSEIELNHSVDIRKLAQSMNLEYDDLRDLNPSYKRGVAFDRSGKLTLRVPKGVESLAMEMAPQAVAQARRMYVADEDYTYYRVRRGDTISGLARKFGTSQNTILKLNNMSRRTNLIAGRRIRVPAERIEGGARREARNTASYVKGGLNRHATRNSKAFSRGEGRVHIVRRGDTLIEIAKRYRVSLGELTRHNQIERSAIIPIGARISIP